RDRRREVCGSRPARLPGIDAASIHRAVGRAVSGAPSGGRGTRMRLTEIRIAGFGGQGAILAPTLIGRAASIYRDADATMPQNFGPKPGGGSSTAAVVLAGEPNSYPCVKDPDTLVVP